ncbi:MAG: hypothetical protein SFV32_02920 [Opitutaceae bacterium]|nr:hypothetical protein [Opitutaceae bacterium]
MSETTETAKRVDGRLRGWMWEHGPMLVRWSLAIVFVWFGVLKLFDLSPANDIVKRTIYWFDPDVFLPILGVWEVVIGLLLLWQPLVRWGILLMFLQMPGTFLPLVLLPEVCFIRFPFVLTMEGQYIVKNIVLIAAAILVGSRLKPLGSDPSRPRPGSSGEKRRIIVS